MTILDDAGSEGGDFEVSFSVVIVGGGACGLVAALSAHDAGADVVVLERDALPAGSTALSSGMITASGTSLQRAAGIEDTPELFAADIQAKAAGKADKKLLAAICRESGPTIDWLIADHKLDFELVEGAPYPGHARQRTHAPPSRTGTDLMADLLRAVGEAGIDVITSATVNALICDDDQVKGVQYERPDGTIERVGCNAVVLASCGFGGNPDMVAKHLPDMADAIYFGHAGNTGDAVRWGQALGAACRDMGAFQGHGSVATPHAITVSWALLGGGGLLINQRGERFADEREGASELSATVCQQPGGFAWTVIDERLHTGALRFPDYQSLADLGAIRSGATTSDLAKACGFPAEAFNNALASSEKEPALDAPYHAIKVTGALLQTQGGLAIDNKARVLRSDGSPLPNLFAGGGAAQGISGSDGTGYLSCNGLLCAVTLGRIAGREAAV